MKFRNGQKSIIEGESMRIASATYIPKVGYFRVDRWALRKDIAFISMRMRDSSEYTGIRFFYRKITGAVGIHEDIWSEDLDGQWSTPAPIPEGHAIIGFKADLVSSDTLLRHLTFLVGEIGKPEIASEIRFPTLISYPNFDQFSELYQAGEFRLQAIRYKHFLNRFDLSAIQLVFSNGVESPMYATDSSATDTLKTIHINSVRQIGYLSVKIDDGIKFDGLRLYDKQMTYIADVTWNSMPSPTSTWTDLYAIPENH